MENDNRHPNLRRWRTQHRRMTVLAHNKRTRIAQDCPVLFSTLKRQHPLPGRGKHVLKRRHERRIKQSTSSQTRDGQNHRIAFPLPHLADAGVDVAANDVNLGQCCDRPGGVAVPREAHRCRVRAGAAALRAVGRVVRARIMKDLARRPSRCWSSKTVRNAASTAKGCSAGIPGARHLPRGCSAPVCTCTG